MVDKSTDHGKLLLMCLFVLFCFCFFTITLKVLTSISVEVSLRIASAMLCRLVVPSFKHFDVTSMVDAGTDHGKLLLTCLFVCFFFSFH